MTILTRDWSAAISASGCPSALVTGEQHLIIVGTSTGDVVAIRGDGSEAWRTPLGSTPGTWPTIDELPGLGACILVGTESGDVVCLNPAGVVLWRTHLHDSFGSFNSVARVHGSDTIDLVATGRNGVVTGMTADGRVVWEFHSHGQEKWNGKGVGPAAVGDIDGDGCDEIAFSSADGNAYCISADGSFRWSVYVGDASEYTTAVMTDCDGNRCVLVGGTDDRVHCITGDGQVLWTQRGRGAGYIEGGLSVGDINGDGNDEVVFVHQGRALQAADGSGEMLWSSIDYVGGDQPYGPSIGDVNGDGLPELILAQRGGVNARVIDGEGNLLEEFEIPGGMLGAPVIADVDGDGKLEVLTVAQSDGTMTCYRTVADTDTADVPWPRSLGGFDGRANRLGGGTSMSVPTDLTDSVPSCLHGTESLRPGVNELTCETSADDVVTEVTVTGPGGVPKRTVIGDPRRVAARFELLDTGEYTLASCSIDTATWARSEAKLAVGTISLFETKTEEIDELLAKLADLIPSAGDAGVELTRNHRRLRFRRADIMEQIALYCTYDHVSRQAVIEEVDDLVATLRREVACQEVRIARSVESGSHEDFLAWETDHPWIAFGPAHDEPGTPITTLDLRTDLRGHEAVVVQIANMTAVQMDVRAWLDPIAVDGGDAIPPGEHLELRQVTMIPTPSGTMAPDSLPALGNAGLLHIDGSSSARLWIDVLTRDLPAGTYTTILHLRALTPNGTTLDVPLSWLVEPVALPEAMPVHFCNWGYGFANHFKHVHDVALTDMQDHYTSVFPSVPMPRIVYDADGTIVEEGDWSVHNHFLSQMRPQNVLLLGASPVVPGEGVDGMYTETWRRAFAAFLPRLVERLASKGFGYDRWAFYPVDEPGLHGGILIQRLEEYARFVKGIDQKVQIYTDPYRGMTVEDHTRILDVLDIVQPALYGVVISDNPDRIEFMKSTDQTHWIYEANAGVKERADTRYYWEMIWTAWELGFTGVGYWTFCTTGFDLWSAEADYVMVYQGADGPVPSVRWQAIRIGIEDYARMARLHDAIAHAEASGRGKAAANARSRIEGVVNEAKASLWDPAIVAGIRREVVDLTLNLRT